MSTILNDRLIPEFIIKESGRVIWKEALIDYDASKFYRGKQVTDEEYNHLFLNQASTSNYLTDSLKTFFEQHLNNIIYRQLINDLKLLPSYVKLFSSSDWGALQSDGYYYISVPASEHGFEVMDDYDPTTRLNIECKVYLLNHSGKFYDIDNILIAPDNTISIYTDDNTLNGFLVVRTNDKAYGLSTVVANVNQIEDIALVAKTNDYEDLFNKPTERFQNIENSIRNILDGVEVVGKSTFAVDAEVANILPSTGKINGVDISSVFKEPGSNIIKQAINADILTGFEGKEDAADWGIQTGEVVTVLRADSTDPNSACHMAFRKNCPEPGKLSLVIDGNVYVNEGQEPVVSLSSDERVMKYKVLWEGDQKTGSTSTFAPDIDFHNKFIVVKLYYTVSTGGIENAMWVYLSTPFTIRTSNTLPVASWGNTLLLAGKGTSDTDYKGIILRVMHGSEYATYHVVKILEVII